MKSIYFFVLTTTLLLISCQNTPRWAIAGSRGGSGGSMTSNFYISDVVLTATGESVVGASVPAALSPDYFPVIHHVRCHTPRGLNEWEGTL